MEPMRTVGYRHLAAVAALLGFGACADEISAPVEPNEELVTETRSVGAPNLSTVYNSAPSMALCGPEAKYTLFTGRYTPGTVRVGNDATNLYVTYATEGEWFLSETRVAIGKTLAKIPLDSKRRIDPWAFPNAGTHKPVVQAYTFSIPLASLGLTGGENVVVAAWAGMVHPVVKGKWDGAWEWITGWGLGNISGTNLGNLSNYKVAACPNLPPPPPVATGAISITFDDGWAETYTRAFPLLQAAGLRANSAIWPVAIDGRYGGFMRIENVRALHDAGWAIVSHSMTHPYLTTLTPDSLDFELRESKAWIQRNNFRTPKVFVVPFHNWGDRERTAIRQYYSGARGTSANQWNPPRLQKMPITDPYGLTAFEPEFAPYTTPEGRALTKQYLDRAVAEGAYIDILFHRIPEANMPAFQEMVNILAQYKPYIRTYDQLVP
jgi:peptidoglycan/xylan/chitin deacetylase (PgdA/CDA1 family)